MKAKEARQKALDITQGKSADQLEKVLKTIIAAVSKGELSTTIYEKLLTPVKSKLEEDGYKISAKDEIDRNESYPATTINW